MLLLWFLLCFAQFGSEVRKYLPQDNEANRKKPFLKHIFTEFDRIDGKPTKSDLQVGQWDVWCPILFECLVLSCRVMM